jgi:polar amino acid transport system substrate-binding protein
VNFRRPVRTRDDVNDGERLEAVEQRLRDDGSGDPTYAPGRFARLAESGLVEEVAQGKIRLVTRRPMATAGGLGSIGTAIALVLVLAFFVVRAGIDLRGPGQSGRPNDLAARVQASGALRMAIRPDFPQVTLAGGTYGGFDSDVAKELARRLGLRAEIVATPRDQILAGDLSDAWDIAFPSEAVPAPAAGRFQATRPYYYWPVLLLVTATSTATLPGDLSGQTVCVVAGSGGAAWLDGRPPSSVTSAAPPPANVRSKPLKDDAACLADLAAGASAAALTATLTTADLAARPALRSLGPVFVESRSIIARLEGPDPTSLITRIDSALADARADRTLTSLSQRRFGGVDLSAPPAP